MEDHGDSMHGWLKATIEEKDITTKCLQCHAFASHDRNVHNTTWPNEKYPDNVDMGEQECVKCHIEHKGADHDLKALTNEQCAFKS